MTSSSPQPIGCPEEHTERARARREWLGGCEALPRSRPMPLPDGRKAAAAAGYKRSESGLFQPGVRRAETGAKGRHHPGWSFVWHLTPEVEAAPGGLPRKAACEIRETREARPAPLWRDGKRDAAREEQARSDWAPQSAYSLEATVNSLPASPGVAKSLPGEGDTPSLLLQPALTPPHFSQFLAASRLEVLYPKSPTATSFPLAPLEANGIP